MIEFIRIPFFSFNKQVFLRFGLIGLRVTLSLLHLQLWYSFWFFCFFIDVRQECPLLSYLFINYADTLSQLLKIVVDNNLLSAYKPSRSKVFVSHLIFVDDYILFVRATLNNARTLSTILQNYYAVSRQQINFEKSMIKFSYKMNTLIQWRIKNLHIKECDGTWQYLGIPISDKRLFSIDHNGIIQKFLNHLDGWKQKVLSMIGQLLLLNQLFLHFLFTILILLFQEKSY